jgi:hypothetical protein
LGEEARKIRNIRIKWDTRRNPDSSVRRGHIIKLFQSHSIFEEFQKRYWPYYDTKSGKAKYAWYLRVVAKHDLYQQSSGRNEEIEKPSSLGEIDNQYYLIAEGGAFKQYRYKNEDDLEKLVEALGINKKGIPRIEG